MSRHILGVFCVTTPQSAWSRKYRETSQKREGRRKWCGEKERGGREGRKIEEKEEGEGEEKNGRRSGEEGGGRRAG